MANFIIIVILLVMFSLGIKETIKHLKGQGACCGGAVSKPKKKKLKNHILHTYIFSVEGIQCRNCVSAVTSAINGLDGVSAKVSLKKKTAVVSCDREINVESIREAIQKKGYEAWLSGER